MARLQLLYAQHMQLLHLLPLLEQHVLAVIQPIETSQLNVLQLAILFVITVTALQPLIVINADHLESPIPTKVVLALRIVFVQLAAQHVTQQNAIYAK